MVLTGCPTVCQGVGCEDRFDAALAGVLRGVDQPQEGTVSPLDTWVQVVGDEDQGPDWDLWFAPPLLLVGSPLDGTVRAFDLGESAGFVPDDAPAQLTTGDGLSGFGAAIASVPDLDGDGVDDLVVGAPWSALSTTSRHDGAFSVYARLANAEAWTGELDASDHRILSVSGNDSGSELGTVVAGCRDLDGDGRGEVLATAPLDNSGGPLSGSIVLVTSTEFDEFEGTILAPNLPHRWVGSGIGARAGTAVSCTHDLTGDGIPDILVGAPFADVGSDASGALYLLPGGEDLPDGGPLFAVAALTLGGEEAEEWLGASLATGDVNGDGQADVVAGAPGGNGGAGLVRVWDGAVLDQGGIQNVARFTGTQEGERFGQSVSLSDIDGDGQLDLLVGAPKYVPDDGSDASGSGAYDSGALYVFMGDGIRGWRGEYTGDEAELLISTAQPYLRTGELVRTADVDGDGQAEIALRHRLDPE